MWTAFASVFSLLLGYSRVPYAAALDGDYFKSFSRVHPVHRFPNVSLVVLGILAIFFCLFRLQDVLAALVVIRLMIQFLAQTVGVIVFRIRRPDLHRPFRMWFYPLPAIIALVGFLYILIMRPGFTREIQYGAVILIVGAMFFFFRNWKRKDWPFAA
jgi:amino acid transporter